MKIKSEKHKSKYTVIDLFSGSGGSALGFRQSGYKIGAAVEINYDASRTFSANFPEAKVFNNDIRSVSASDILNSLKEKDPNKLIILACPPCQGFSSARRVSQRDSDPRNNLIMDFVRLVRDIQPIMFIMENVPGLVGAIGKSIFTDAESQLKESGYSNIIKNVFEVADFGVPQKRKRLVMIGCRNGTVVPEFPDKVYLKHGTGNKKWRTVRDTISDLPKISAGETSSSDPIHISSKLSDLNIQRIKHTSHDGGDRKTWPSDLLLPCHINGGFTDVYARMKWDEPSPTVTGGCIMLSKGRFGHPDQDRAISLREAARLQTFPDSFIFIGNRGSIAKQIGNAVPTLFAKIIAKKVLNSLKNINFKKSSFNLSENQIGFTDHVFTPNMNY